VEPSFQFLSVTQTMCGLSVGGVTKVDCKREPDLYDSKAEWYAEMGQIIIDHGVEVRKGLREPNECGTDEELRAVLVYEDGRIIDACDLVTDYRKIFDRDNTS